jgi:hypothetical protein
MWIPRPLYEVIPHVSVVAGVACFAAAYFTDSGPRGSAFALGGLFVTVGLVLWMKRRDYRSTQSDYDPRALDE